MSAARLPRTVLLLWFFYTLYQVSFKNFKPVPTLYFSYIQPDIPNPYDAFSTISDGAPTNMSTDARRIPTPSPLPAIFPQPFKFVGDRHWFKTDLELCHNAPISRFLHPEDAYCQTEIVGFNVYRVEFMSSEPIYIIHNVFSESQIREFLDFESEFTPAKPIVANHNSDGIQARGIEIPIKLYELTKLFLATAKAAIGFRMQDIEGIQIVTFGPGGHHAYHSDFLTPTNNTTKNKELKLRGNRVLTIVVLLKEAESGGEIMFPDAGVALKMAIGDLAYWYNMEENGKKEERTSYGHCPVYAGEIKVAKMFLRMTTADFKQLSSS
ncbi:unnamed protein product [Caenorhabditis sp. 36 PRJEB53466]|nr:unnamed protein product [Caenorhabditis sp. 36 PRJEB53466]